MVYRLLPRSPMSRALASALLALALLQPAAALADRPGQWNNAPTVVEHAGQKRALRTLFTRKVPFRGRNLLLIQREVKHEDGRVEHLVIVPGYHVSTEKDVSQIDIIGEIPEIRAAKAEVLKQPGLKGHVVVWNEP